MANGQFQVADVVGNVRQGQQFAVNLDQQQALRERQAKLAPLQFQSAQLGVQQQQQQLSQAEQRSALERNIQTALELKSVPDNQKAAVMTRKISEGEDVGRDMSQSKQALELINAGRFEELAQGGDQLIEIGERFNILKPKGGSQSAEGKSFESLIANFSDADKTKARRVKAGLDPRMVGSAIQTITEQGIETDIANVEKVITEAKEIGKLTAQHKLKPVVDAAVIAAVGQAKAEVAKLGEERSSVKTLDIYNNSMSNLTKALDNTITGPFIGLTPALTDNAQIADGAIAMMLPLMKDVFRGAGEGTFTEGDQKILTDMIPTRSDSAEARKSKIMFIDELIRARLTTAPVAEAQPSGLSEAEQAELQQLRAEFGGQ